MSRAGTLRQIRRRGRDAECAALHGPHQPDICIGGHDSQRQRDPATVPRDSGGAGASRSLGIYGTLLGVALALGIVIRYWQVNILAFGMVVFAQKTWVVCGAVML